MSPLPETVAGVPCLRLHAPDGASALVSRWGAQVLSWCPAGGDERLFLSPRAVLDGSAPIRGGVPIVFPQFASYGPLPAHGFARDRPWTLRAHETDAITLALNDDEPLRALWPHAFACEFTLRIGGASLAMELRIANHGCRAFTFQAALHTYLRVDDLALLRVEGLASAPYLDRADGDRRGLQQEHALAFVGEVDRVYPDAPRSVALRESRRTTEVVMSGGFTDVVLWNPGAARCARIADFDPDAHRWMLCIEAARIASPQSLLPGQAWCGTQRLTVL